MSKLLLCCLALLFTFSACEKQNIKRAEKSLDGTWLVTKIYSAYGEKMEFGTQTNEEFTEEGDLGTFTFSNASVDFKYTRLDTLYEDSSDWDLTRQKVNVGFTKAEQYTLTFDNKSYRCRFGDETKDAEKKATELTLQFETEAIGSYNAVMFWLVKA